MIKAVVFDAFGTLFRLAAKPASTPEEARRDEIINYIRHRQLERSWLLSLMKQYLPFDELTEEVIQEAREIFPDWKIYAAEISSLFNSPIIFPDVKPGLDALAQQQVRTGILSNGAPASLKKVVALNGLEDQLSFLLSADSVKTFKPSPAVYQLVLDKLALKKEEILFVSSNQWDVAGASSFGFITAWVNRRGEFRQKAIRGGQVFMAGGLNSIHELVSVLNRS